MRNKPEQEATPEELPHINATTYYDTKGAAAILGLKEGALRQMRFRNCGPKYQQPTENGRCQYLGSWLISYRRSIIVEPGQFAGGRRR